MCFKKRFVKKVFKIKKRIISGLENLDTMRFIVGRFTSFSPEIEFLPNFSFYGIIFYGTSTPPARGGELAHDGYNT